MGKVLTGNLVCLVIPKDLIDNITNRTRVDLTSNTIFDHPKCFPCIVIIYDLKKKNFKKTRSLLIKSSSYNGKLSSSFIYLSTWN